MLVDGWLLVCWLLVMVGCLILLVVGVVVAGKRISSNSSNDIDSTGFWCLLMVGWLVMVVVDSC